MPSRAKTNQKSKRIKLRDKNIYDMIAKGVFKPKVVSNKKKAVKKFKYNEE